MVSGKFRIFYYWAFGQNSHVDLSNTLGCSNWLNLRPRQGISLPPKSYCLTILRLATLQNAQREKNEQVQDSKPSYICVMFNLIFKFINKSSQCFGL